MIPKIDVVVENFAPGVIGAMGLGYEALTRINPKLMMASISVAGQPGPLSSKPGYDYLGAALAGSYRSNRRARSHAVVPAMAIGDVSTGVAAAMAVGFALLHRERTGEGQYIDASLIDTYFHMHELCVPMVSLRPGRFVPKRTGSIHPTGSPVGVFQANDGYVFLVVQQHEIGGCGARSAARSWRAIRASQTNRDRMKHNPALKEIIETWLATFPDRDSALAELDEVASRARRSTSWRNRWRIRICASATPSARVKIPHSASWISRHAGEIFRMARSHGSQSLEAWRGQRSGTDGDARDTHQIRLRSFIPTASCFTQPTPKAPPQEDNFVKHAEASALDVLEPVLAQLRTLEGLKEKNARNILSEIAGVPRFSRRPRRAFRGLKKGGDFVRFPVNNRAEIAALIREAKRVLAD